MPDAVLRSPTLRSPSLDPAVCTLCSCALVQPLESHRVGPAHAQVTLRCPNCLHVRTGVFAQSVVDRFEEELDRARQDLIDALARDEVRDGHRLTVARLSWSSGQAARRA